MEPNKGLYKSMLGELLLGWGKQLERKRNDYVRGRRGP